MSTPHDALFKGVLGNPEHARGALQAVVPAMLADELDWRTLVHQPGSFVEPGLPGQHTDLLFSAEWRNGRDEAPVFFLFEHQSTLPEGSLMAFRLLRYKVRIWERWHAEHPRTHALPIIVPIVLYHGAPAWSVPRFFGDLLAMRAGMRSTIGPYLVEFSYLLDNLSELPDDHLRRRSMTALGRLAAVCFKYGRQPDLVERLGRDWADVLREVAGAPQGQEAMEQVLRYILEVNDEHLDPEELKALLERELGPKAKEAIVTAAQRYIEQGRQQGESAMLLRQLRHRFGGAVDAHVEERVAKASVEQIDTWAVRVLTAATLAELFAD
jgi:predicted transposase YdaD